MPQQSEPGSRRQHHLTAVRAGAVLGHVEALPRPERECAFGHRHMNANGPVWERLLRRSPLDPPARAMCRQQLLLASNLGRAPGQVETGSPAACRSAVAVRPVREGTRIYAMA
jgi:hypothetical protein